MSGHRIIFVLMVLATALATHLPTCCCWTHAIEERFAPGAIIAMGGVGCVDHGGGRADSGCDLCCQHGTPSRGTCPNQSDQDDHDRGGCGCIGSSWIAGGSGPTLHFGGDLIAILATAELRDALS